MKAKLNILFIFVVILTTNCEKNIVLDSSETKNGAYYPVASIFSSDGRRLLFNSPLLIDPLPGKFYKGLVAYYPFDDGAKDAGPNELHGVVYSKPHKTGKEEITTFNNLNDTTFIKIKDEDHLLDFANEKSFSLCAWIKNNHKIDVVQSILGKPRTYPEYAGGYALAFVNPIKGEEGKYPRVGFGMLDGVMRSGQNIDCNINLSLDWQFIVATFNGTNLRLYINGEFKSDGKMEGQLYPSDAFFFIGRDLDLEEEPLPRYFYGGIDNVMIFDYALEQSQIIELYNLRQK